MSKPRSTVVTKDELGAQGFSDTFISSGHLEVWSNGKEEILVEKISGNRVSYKSILEDND